MSLWSVGALKAALEAPGAARLRIVRKERCAGHGLQKAQTASRSSSAVGPLNWVAAEGLTVEARKLEHDRPPSPNKNKKNNQHKSSDIHFPTFWSLLLFRLP